MCSARRKSAFVAAVTVLPVMVRFDMVTPATCGGTLPALTTTPSITFARVLPVIATPVVLRWLRPWIARNAPPTVLPEKVRFDTSRSLIAICTAHGAAALAAVTSVGATRPRSSVLPEIVAFITPSRLMPRRPVEVARLWLRTLAVTVRPSTLKSTMPVSALPAMPLILLPVIVQFALPMPPPEPRPKRIALSVVPSMRLLRITRLLYAFAPASPRIAEAPPLKRMPSTVMPFEATVMLPSSVLSAPRTAPPATPAFAPEIVSDFDSVRLSE